MLLLAAALGACAVAALAITWFHPVRIGWSARVDTPVGVYRFAIHEYDINAEAHPDLVLYRRLGGLGDLIFYALGWTSSAELGMRENG